MKKLMIVLTVAVISFAHGAKAENPAPFVTGGVGNASQRAIANIQDDYNLKLVFSGQGGIYLADVAVRIKDKNGVEVMNGISEGPLLLGKLKPGKYIVEASAENLNLNREVTVGNSLKTYGIQFPIKDERSISILNKIKSKGYDADLKFPYNVQFVN